jgi:hypothetical protein
MHVRWLAVLTAFAVMHSSLVLAEQSQFSGRDKIHWRKVTNYNVRSVSTKKIIPKIAVTSKAVPEQSINPQPPRILATFDYGGSAVSMGPANELFAAPKAAPVRCEWARSIVSGYAFENVEAKACEGSMYDFEAMRGGKRFSIQISALNGELIKVQRIDPGIDARVRPEVDEMLIVEPAGQ